MLSICETKLCHDIFLSCAVLYSFVDDITAAGNMKDVPEFKDWLGQTFGDPSLWESLIRPAMKHIIVCTTKYEYLIISSNA